ncbi:hypothetical protein BP5796_12642 [Coleophoma crateriformis]|uniref:Transcription factor domain-containing protein n=1 Tax=Coleophoma crateriformis TaxID=565419 RepID=A0A3D8Q5V1_9HELO|nr:hypothetical protein BP5796_12642 [Coleophoma crateriformis]
MIRGTRQRCRKPESNLALDAALEDQDGSGRLALSLVTSLATRVEYLESQLKSGSSALAAADPETCEGAISLGQRIRLQVLPQPEQDDSFHADVSSSPGHGGGAGLENTTTVLEYLARGHLATHVTRNVKPNTFASPSPFGNDVPEDNIFSWRRFRSAFGDDKYLAIEQLRLRFLQDLLPSQEQVVQLFNFHRSRILWVHNSFHGPSFSSELDRFYQHDHGEFSPSSSGLQWAALHFAIMSSSMACAKSNKIIRWGFDIKEQCELARLWYDAATECMSVARCFQTHNMCTPQAIATMTWAAHTLGNGDIQTVLEAAAIRISQSLGLHHIAEIDGLGGQYIEHDQRLKDIIQQEAGRRLWQQLTLQDWFSVPFSENYSVTPIHFLTTKPMNCNDLTMEPLPPTIPTITTYNNFLHSIAILMPELLDKLCEAATMHTKYEVVLQYDR